MFIAQHKKGADICNEQATHWLYKIYERRSSHRKIHQYQFETWDIFQTEARQLNRLLYLFP